VALTFPERLALQDALGACLDDVKKCFKPGSKITLIVRNPQVGDDAGVVIGDDRDYEAVIAEIRKAAGR
jgi:pyoverdine/dityrosine biosynthesis protein Dit1